MVPLRKAVFFVIIIARLLQYEVCVELCQKRQMEVQYKISRDIVIQKNGSNTGISFGSDEVREE